MADKGEKKSILSTVVFSFIYLLGVFATIFFGPVLYKNNRKSIKFTNRFRHACYSNLRVIQGAVETYNMDVKEKMTTLDQELLRNGHYLKKDKDLVCPEPPEHGTYSGENLTKDGEIICSYHGGLIAEGPYDEEEKAKELSKQKESKQQKYYKQCLEMVPYALAWPALLVLILFRTIANIIL